MKVRKEITVALENKPGVLGHLCKCLGEKGINVLAISVVESANVGIVRMVVNKPEAAADMICECCPVTMSVCEVLQLAAPNKPGVLAAIASKLGKRKINIDYIYGSAMGKGRASIILKPSDLKKAAKALKGF